MLRRIPILLFALAQAACIEASPRPIKEHPVQDMPAVQAKLAFACTYEKDRIPPRDPEADQLYRYARWLQKNNRLRNDPSIYPKVERLIRIATAYGHDKANLELRELIGKRQAKSDNAIQETLDLVEDLIARGIPGGYYDMGRYVETGFGVKRDAEVALKYYRKSADLGSPEGQYLVASKLAPIDMAPDVAREMRQCAAEQGHGKAGLELGVHLQDKHKFTDALQAFQLSSKAGNAMAASFLMQGFKGPSAENELDYIGQQADHERVRRYQIIWQVLADYDYLNPKVPEIDEIVPLPPAKLPPWDGKLKWLKEHEANVPPPLPKEERIAEMARAKGLDPATGRAVSAK